MRIRQETRRFAIEAGMGLVDQTKLVTAASELARNTLTHGGGGEATIAFAGVPPRCGVRILFQDHGPGIADIEQAMRDGYTTGKGMGLGLGGSRRLCKEFSIESKPGSGTRVTIAHGT